MVAAVKLYLRYPRSPKSLTFEMTPQPVGDSACLGVLHVDVTPLRPRTSVRVSEMDGKDCTEPKGSPQRYWLRLVAHAAARVAAPQVGPHWTTTRAV